MQETPQFQLEVIGEGHDRHIRFTNESDNYIEVQFLIDGLEVKSGKPVSEHTKGYAMYPREHRLLTKTPDHNPLPFAAHGTVEAVVYEGSGTPVDTAIEMAPFVRRKIGAKIKFRRYSDRPSARLSVVY